GLTRACKILSAYQMIEPRDKNRVELLSVESPIAGDPISNGIGNVDFLGIKGVSLSLRHYIDAASAESISFHFDVTNGSKETVRKVYELIRKGSAFALDLLAERDLRNPYGASEDPKEANIFRLGKWPIDIWARETFDTGKYEELFVESIDRNVPGTTEAPKVAAKIFLGDINGNKACFYMKDSRINGGATGDLEGLKYLAAVYIAYLKGWPLYVWNDGAGANILQGMVSLNRGSEGFMMNTLSGNMKRDEFLAYARNSSDPRVVELFKTVDGQYFKDGFDEFRSYHFTAAIGIGSSAGLDVYGSSQAPVQLILDSEQSYRVLTGSNVIRSVMGEDISNYDIGGARVMSKWAGVVDLVATDKYHMISQIRRLHDIFSSEARKAEIDRSTCIASDSQEVNHFSENMVMTNVDGGDFVPFKHDYYGSGSVVAGFAKIGGRRVAVIGPRSSDGLRSYASVTRARDVLRTSDRLGVHPVLVMGKRWHEAAEIYDESGVRARIDFVNTLAAHKGLRICILTEIQGFQSLEIISNCDVLIYASKEELSPAANTFVEKNATFIVKDMESAFNIAHTLIELVDPINKKAGDATGTPIVPNDTASPYDMIESVIKKVADNGAFVEFFSAQNLTKTRSNFITGLATIGGETVGILADQPLILGGGADAPSTEKFRIFTQFVNRFGIRLLMLSNASGFIPGTKQERIRIQAIGAEALDTNIIGKVPVVSVVLNQNYGGRAIQAFSKHLRPGIHYIARENATLAVLGHSVAFDLFKAKKFKELVDAGKSAEAEAMRKEFIDGYLDKAKAKNDAYATGAVDEIIRDMKDLRSMIL
ncbi:MAG TPA: carboxyl transferase domain-containing protein, partial [Spirochaetota bacterium]